MRALCREVGQPLVVIRREALFGVVDTCAGHAVESKRRVGGDSGVVVPHYCRDLPFAQRVDTVCRPRVVSHHVARTQQPVDSGHILENGLEGDPVAVDVRNESHLHARCVQLQAVCRFGTRKHITPLASLDHDSIAVRSPLLAVLERRLEPIVGQRDAGRTDRVFELEVVGSRAASDALSAANSIASGLSFS